MTVVGAGGAAGGAFGEVDDRGWLARGRRRGRGGRDDRRGGGGRRRRGLRAVRLLGALGTFDHGAGRGRRQVAQALQLVGAPRVGEQPEALPFGLFDDGAPHQRPAHARHAGELLAGIARRDQAAVLIASTAAQVAITVARMIFNVGSMSFAARMDVRFVGPHPSCESPITESVAEVNRLRVNKGKYFNRPSVARAAALLTDLSGEPAQPLPAGPDRWHPRCAALYAHRPPATVRRRLGP